jgi:ribosomal protein L12E/L44/L45/RPP1/RPP2
MLHEMTITVDDAVYETLRPFMERQTIGELLSDFARSRFAKPAYTQAELEAGYRAMAADAEREAEAQEWCNALIGDIADDDAR